MYCTFKSSSTADGLLQVFGGRWSLLKIIRAPSLHLLYDQLVVSSVTWYTWVCVCECVRVCVWWVIDCAAAVIKRCSQSCWTQSAAVYWAEQVSHRLITDQLINCFVPWSCEFIFSHFYSVSVTFSELKVLKLDIKKAPVRSASLSWIVCSRTVIGWFIVAFWLAG